MAIRAKFAGTCADTGRRYDAGTMISKGPNGWRIDGDVQEWRNIRLSPLAVEFGGDGETVTEKRANVAGPMYCGCVKTLPGFDAKDEKTFSPCRYDRDGDRLTCPHCGRTGEILPEPKREKLPPETRTCWECGCEFTYADAKRHGGDWSESYCGC